METVSNEWLLAQPPIAPSLLEFHSPEEEELTPPPLEELRPPLATLDFNIIASEEEITSLL